MAIGGKWDPNKNRAKCQNCGVLLGLFQDPYHHYSFLKNRWKCLPTKFRPNEKQIS